MHSFYVFGAFSASNSYSHTKEMASKFDGCVSPGLVSEILILGPRELR